MWPIIGVTLKVTSQRTAESLKRGATNELLGKTSKGRMHKRQLSPHQHCAPGGRHLCWWDEVFGADWYRLLVDNSRCRAVLILEKSRCGRWGISSTCCSVGVVSMSTDEGNSAKIDVLMVHGKPLAFDLLLGGIIVGTTASIQLGNGRITKCAAISTNTTNSTKTNDTTKTADWLTQVLQWWFEAMKKENGLEPQPT